MAAFSNFHAAQQVSSAIECIICHEIFEDPRMLPCGHTFCLACLQQMVESLAESSNSGQFSCPCCRTNCNININSRSLQKLPKNFAVVSMIASLPAAIKDYKMWNSQESNQAQEDVSNRMPREQYCDEHRGQEITMFCSTCQYLGCNTCATTTHKAHGTVDLQTADSQFITQLKTTSKLIDKMIGKWQKQMKMHQEANKLLENESKKVVSELEEVIKSTEAELRAEFEQLLNQLTTAGESAIQRVHKQKNDEMVLINKHISTEANAVQELQQKAELLKKSLRPTSTVFDRASFSMKQLHSVNTAMGQQNLSNGVTTYQLTDITKWTEQLKKWQTGITTSIENFSLSNQIIMRTQRNIYHHGYRSNLASDESSNSCRIPTVDLLVTRRSIIEERLESVTHVKNINVAENSIILLSVSRNGMVLAGNQYMLYICNPNNDRAIPTEIQLTTDSLFDAAWLPSGRIVYTGTDHVVHRSQSENKVVTISQSGDIMAQTKMKNPQHLCVSNNDVYIAAGEEGVYQSTDDGVTWSCTFELPENKASGFRFTYQMREIWQCCQVVKVPTDREHEDFWTLENKQVTNRMTYGFSQTAAQDYTNANWRLRVYTVNRSSIEQRLTWRDVNMQAAVLQNIKMVYDGHSNIIMADSQRNNIHVWSVNGESNREMQLVDDYGSSYQGYGPNNSVCLAIDSQRNVMFVTKSSPGRGTSSGIIKMFALKYNSPSVAIQSEIDTVESTLPMTITE